MAPSEAEHLGGGDHICVSHPMYFHSAGLYWCLMNIGGMGEYLGEWAEEQKAALVHNIVGWVVLEI